MKRQLYFREFNDRKLRLVRNYKALVSEYLYDWGKTLLEGFKNYRKAGEPDTIEFLFISEDTKLMYERITSSR